MPVIGNPFLTAAGDTSVFAITRRGPMKVVKTSYDRRDERRDRRYPLPALDVLIGGTGYSTVNWSLGGCLIGSFSGEAVPGGTITGTLRAAGSDTILRFTGMVVRVGTPPDGLLAIQFTDLGEDGIEILDRYIARRMFGRRKGSSS